MTTKVVVDSRSMVLYTVEAFISFLSRKHNFSLGTVSQENINAFDTAFVLVETLPKPTTPEEITTYVLGRPKTVAGKIVVEWEGSRANQNQINSYYNKLFEELVEDEVKALGYKDVANAFTYTTSHNPRILAEVKNFFSWRDRIWDEFEKLVNPHIDDLVGSLEVQPMTKQDLIDRLSKLPKIIT